MKLALIGNGGHAREVQSQMGKKMICFVEDRYIVNKSENVLPLSDFDPTEFKVMIAVGDSGVRQDLFNKLPKNTQFFSFVHPTCLILSEDIKIGEGSFIGALSVLTTNISIGDHTILNRGNQIGHDCIIGNFFSMMPGSIVSGNCVIGDRVYIGTNSSVKEKIKIVDDTIIGLNTGVVKNIELSGTYVGIPARKLNNKF